MEQYDDKIKRIIDFVKSELGDLEFIGVVRLTDEDVTMFGSCSRAGKLDLLSSAVAQVVSEVKPEDLVEDMKKLIAKREGIDEEKITDEDDFSDHVNTGSKKKRGAPNGLLAYVKDKLRKKQDD